MNKILLMILLIIFLIILLILWLFFILDKNEDIEASTLLFIGLFFLALGSMFGTYYVAKAGSKENTDRIDALEETFTTQTDILKKQSGSIEKLGKITKGIVSENREILRSVSDISIEIEKIASSIEIDINELGYSDFLLRIGVSEDANLEELLDSMGTVYDLHLTFWQLDGHSKENRENFIVRLEKMATDETHEMIEFKPQPNKFTYNPQNGIGYIISELTSQKEKSTFSKSNRLYFKLGSLPKFKNSHYSFSLQRKDNGVIYKAEHTKETKDNFLISFEGYFDFKK